MVGVRHFVGELRLSWSANQRTLGLLVHSFCFVLTFEPPTLSIPASTETPPDICSRLCIFQLKFNLAQRTPR